MGYTRLCSVLCDNKISKVCMWDQWEAMTIKRAERKGTCGGYTEHSGDMQHESEIEIEHPRRYQYAITFKE